MFRGVSLPWSLPTLLIPQKLALCVLSPFLPFFLSVERKFLRKASYFLWFCFITSMPYWQTTKRLEGLKILFLITREVYQLCILWFSFSKLAVFGHIPSICLKFSFKYWITSCFWFVFYFYICLRFFRYSRSVNLSTSFSTWSFSSLRRSLCITTCLTRSNSLSSSITKSS